jgi:hypothetical protein
MVDQSPFWVCYDHGTAGDEGDGGCIICNDIANAIVAARAEENEACAKIAEDWITGEAIAAKIRKRIRR